MVQRYQVVPEYVQDKRVASFYHGSIDSISIHCFSEWFSCCTVAHKKDFQRITNPAPKIIGCPLPTLEDLCSFVCLKKASNVIKDPFQAEFLIKQREHIHCPCHSRDCPSACSRLSFQMEAVFKVCATTTLACAVDGL